ncbi:pyridoxal-phosphate-dependent/plp-dependent aminotransferase [Shewanella frigidimarina]|uniref:DegT/DnrJ/EryC1/StrS family aminotransferase n=1 Tax=Shewanella frigidimarina TaxID=56812 RepID=UPI000F4F6009|nr:DegT/DnrJ/EryC1/StrS family aminotransferase [Shewanella frigidimarina]RPA63842.1 pyridoxal-phosphate-dependent/plp-dependent aminotransferase [Shewanella frigidimarina]
MDKLFPLFNVVSNQNMQDVFCEVLKSGKIASGSYVELFESNFANLIGQQYALSINDMTNAIHLALRLADVEEDDEVIATPFSCMASNSPIALCKAIPVWIDFKPNSVEIDLIAFESAISEKTKAAIIYHVAGYPTPIDKIALICQKYGIKLIEDCNNALLSTVNGRYVGGFGDFSVFSFYPNRQINTTEGGMLVCKNESDYIQGKKLRRFGINSITFRNSIGEIDPKSDIPVASSSMAMNNICAALGNIQIDEVKDRMLLTQRNAEYYKENFLYDDKIRVVPVMDGSESAYWTFLVQIDNRDKVIELMKSTGISVSSLHQRNDIYSCFKKKDVCHLDNIETFQNTVLALPCGWWLSQLDIEFIAKKLKSVVFSFKISN